MNRMAVRTCRNHSISRATRATSAAACATRATWRIAAATAVALLCLSTAAPGLHAATLAEGKAAAAAGDHPRAGQIFSTVRDSGASDERAEAAYLALYELRETGNHAAVQAQYDASLAAARGSRFESRCMFEYAKSLHYNAKDTTEALRLYERISDEYPTEAFAASGSLLERARIQLHDWAAPNTALVTLEDVWNGYPNSPFADDALVLQARAHGRIGDTRGIETCRARLGQIGAAADAVQKVQFELAECHNKFRNDKQRAAAEYLRVFREYPAGTNVAALAKIRYADLPSDNRFDYSKKLYEDVLANYPKLDKPLRDWALCRKGVCQYQMQDETGAAETFRQVLAANPGPQVRALAEMHLKGFAEPQSPDAARIVYDRAIRRLAGNTSGDLAFWDLHRVAALVDGPAVKAWDADAKTSREERAQMQYRRCYAYWSTGYGNKAYKLAGEILEKHKPQGVTRHQCMFMRAHLQGRGARYAEAARGFQELIAENPKPEILRNSYFELTRALDLGGDALGAVLAMEEAIVRFPNTLEAEKALELRDAQLRQTPTLLAQVEKQRPVIAAKWKSPPVEVARPPADGDGGPALDELDDIAVPGLDAPRSPIASSTGGAE